MDPYSRAVRDALLDAGINPYLCTKIGGSAFHSSNARNCAAELPIHGNPCNLKMASVEIILLGHGFPRL